MSAHSKRVSAQSKIKFITKKEYLQKPIECRNMIKECSNANKVSVQVKRVLAKVKIVSLMLKQYRCKPKDCLCMIKEFQRKPKIWTLDLVLAPLLK